ncbi:MAG: phosphate ABC transporter substrate-binding protein [Clostridium sp.]
MKKKTLKLMVSALLVTMMGTVAVGCGEKTPETSKIAISGSTSVGPLMEKFAKEFQGKNEEVTIEINQTGSSAGIKDAINGVSEFGMSSRDLKDEEKSQVDSTLIAYDGIAVITNTANTVKELTKDQVKGIYTGKITNWKEVGGKDAPIVVVSREEGSGTRSAFEEIVGYKSEELVKEAQIADGSGNIKTTVKGNENAVGFVSFEYLDDSIGALNIDGVQPTAEKVKSKEYKLSRGFLLVNKKGEVSEAGKKFVDWILSDEGQTMAEANGAIKLK